MAAEVDEYSYTYDEESESEAPPPPVRPGSDEEEEESEEGVTSRGGGAPALLSQSKHPPKPGTRPTARKTPAVARTPEVAGTTVKAPPVAKAAVVEPAPRTAVAETPQTPAGAAAEGAETGRCSAPSAGCAPEAVGVLCRGTAR